MLHLLLLDSRREHGVGQSLSLLFGHGGGLSGGCWVLYSVIIVLILF